jgi:hypothetical protein
MDLGGDGRVGGAQVGRRDQELRAGAAGGAEASDRAGYGAQPEPSGELPRPMQSEAQLVRWRDR